MAARLILVPMRVLARAKLHFVVSLISVTFLAVTARATIIDTGGAIEVIAAPPSLELGALEDDLHIRLFNERQNLILAADQPVGITLAGTYDNETQLTLGVIPTGTVIDTWLLHVDPRGSDPIRLAGSVTFGTEIVGLIVRDVGLSATDSILGHPGAVYPAGLSGRGLELSPGLVDGGGNPIADAVSVSSDRRTITISTQATSAMDQVRVVTRATTPPPAAAPSILAVSVFTDNRTADDPFGVPGYQIAFRARIADPGGVPGNISSVTATNLTTNETLLIPFLQIEELVSPGTYFLLVPYSSSRLGVWRFRVTNRQGEVAVLDSHNLDKPVQLQLPSYVTLENFPGTPSNPPRVRFDPVRDATHYQIEIYNDQLVAQYLPPVSTMPFWEIPFGLLSAGQRYVFRGRALQLDQSEPVVPRVDRLENRSVNFIRADPGTFLTRPRHPVLLVHGTCSDLFTWTEVFSELVNRGWKFGGTPPNLSGSSPDADFYLMNFSDPLIRAGLLQWGLEVSRALRQIAEHRTQQGLSAPRFIVVAHSGGGLGVRAYFQSQSTLLYRGDIHHLATYGTPHSGTRLADSDLANVLATRYGGTCANLTVFDVRASQGIQDMRPGSSFLHALNDALWPREVFVTALIGSNRACGFVPTGLATPNDCVVDTASQDPSQIHQPPPQETLERWFRSSVHWNETSDTTAIIWAIRRGDLVGGDRLAIRVASPVDVVVTDPLGRTVSKVGSTIPLASYEEVEDEQGHISDSVLIPIALRGEYRVEVAREAGTHPSDTFSITALVNSAEISIVQDLPVQAIPPDGFGILVRDTIPVDINIKPGGSPNTINRASEGRIAVAILSHPDFNAVQRVIPQSLSFGPIGFEASVVHCGRNGEDVNGDGLLDLVCHFDTADTAFTIGDTHGVLRGQTVEGAPIEGSDTVRIIR